MKLSRVCLGIFLTLCASSVLWADFPNVDKGETLPGMDLRETRQFKCVTVCAAKFNDCKRSGSVITWFNQITGESDKWVLPGGRPAEFRRVVNCSLAYRACLAGC